MPTQGSAALDFNDQAGSVDCLDHLASADDALQFLLHAKRLFAFLIAGTKTQLTSSSSAPPTSTQGARNRQSHVLPNGR